MTNDDFKLEPTDDDDKGPIEVFNEIYFKLCEKHGEDAIVMKLLSSWMRREKILKIKAVSLKDGVEIRIGKACFVQSEKESKRK